MEEVRDIPAGILTCLVDGCEVTIEQISPEALWIRTAEPLLFVERSVKLELLIYEAQENQYQKVDVPCYKAEKLEQKRYYQIYKIIVVQNEEYEQAVHKITMTYFHYIQKRYESMDYVFPIGKSVKGYDASLDEQFPEDIESQMERWQCNGKIAQIKNSDQKSMTLEQSVLKLVQESKGRVSLACCLNNPKAYDRFLKMSELNEDRTSKSILKQNETEDEKQREQLYIETVSTCLYIGNPFCHHLLPDSEFMIRMMEKAYQMGKTVTIVLSYLRDEKVEEMQEWIHVIYEYVKSRRAQNHSVGGGVQNADKWIDHVELVINDWGYLPMLVDKQDVFIPVLGTLLNRRRKDPRIQYIEDFQHVEKYGENQLNDSFFRTYMKEQGITRYEYEACGYPMKIAPGQHSLHLPLYQTNTSQLCPLRALVLYGDRGHQVPVDHCAHFCEKYAIAYPEHLHMVGLYNSIFGYDNTLLETDILQRYVLQGIDRIVWNLGEA